MNALNYPVNKVLYQIKSYNIHYWEHDDLVSKTTQL